VETTTRTTSHTTTRTTSHTSNRTSNADRFVVGWAAGLVQVWPDEDPTIVALAAAPAAGPLGSPEAVLSLLARLDGVDERTYRRHYASQAGSVLALTHHTEDEVLAAALEICGSASPAAVLAVVHRGTSLATHQLAS
jgi:hypothetical protein